MKTLPNLTIQVAIMQIIMWKTWSDGQKMWETTIYIKIRLGNWTIWERSAVSCGCRSAGRTVRQLPNNTLVDSPSGRWREKYLFCFSIHFYSCLFCFYALNWNLTIVYQLCRLKKHNGMKITLWNSKTNTLRAIYRPESLLAYCWEAAAQCGQHCGSRSNLR